MLLLGTGHCFRDQVLEVCPELSRFSSSAEEFRRPSRVIAGNDPAHGGFRTWSDRLADDFDSGQTATRFSAGLHPLQAARTGSSCRTGVANHLHGRRRSKRCGKPY